MPNVETFVREVQKLKKKVGGGRELQFYCSECGQPLKSYEHAELIRERKAEEAEEIREMLRQTFASLRVSM
jgi:transcription initiation factor IIE alpha subunit